MVREKKLISDKMSMRFSLSEGNKFHKTSHCSHIVIGLQYLTMRKLVYILMKKNRH
jgi:hypothetical protein